MAHGLYSNDLTLGSTVIEFGIPTLIRKIFWLNKADITERLMRERGIFEQKTSVNK